MRTAVPVVQMSTRRRYRVTAGLDTRGSTVKREVGIHLHVIRADIPKDVDQLTINLIS